MTSRAIHHPPEAVSKLLLAPVLDEHGVPAVIPVESGTHEHLMTRPTRTAEEGMARALKLGTLIGIPSVFAVTGGMGLLGGAGVVASAAIGAWCSLFGGGMYLGGVFFLPRNHDHFERPAEWPTVESAKAKAAAEEAGRTA